VGKKFSRTEIVRKGNDVVGRNHHEVDDNPLPDAEYIAKLYDKDPNILEWLKERAAKEQDYRHEFSKKHLSAVDQSNIRHHSTTRIGILALVIIILVLSACSTFLLINDHKVGGSIFGSSAFFIAITLFVSNMYNKTNKTPQDKVS
jgi:uncharacterized membrane protein